MGDGAERPPARPTTRPHRLRRRQDFLAAAAGKRFHTERVSVQALRRGEPDEKRDADAGVGLRVGFTITKRVGHATERNRIRRRLRRAIEQASGEALALPVDLVVIGRRPALSAGFETLVEDLRRALRAAERPRAGAASGAGRRESAHGARRSDSRRAGAPNPNATTPHGTSDG